jgi:hypothetical protein
MSASAGFHKDRSGIASRVGRSLALVFAVSATTCAAVAAASGGEWPCSDDGFQYGGAPIHPGCVRELMTTVEGDNIVGSINLGRTPARGCDESNRYGQAAVTLEDGFSTYTDPGTQARFGYKHRARIGLGLHFLQVREVLTGSFSWSETIVVRFHREPMVEITQSGIRTYTVDRMTLAAKIGGEGGTDYGAIARAIEASLRTLGSACDPMD